MQMGLPRLTRVKAGKYTNDKRILTGVGLLVATLLVVASLSPRITSGNEADELENDLQATRNQIQQYESQLNNTKSQIEAAKKQAASYAGALQSYSGQMAYAQAQLEQTRLELEEKQLELENTEAKVREATLAVQYHERVLKRVARDFYKKSFGGNIAFWFSESTFGDAARTATYRSRVSDNFHEELSKIVGMLDQLVKQKEQLAADKESFEKQQQELTDRQAYLRNQIATANTNLSQSQGQQQRLTSDLAAIQDKLAQLNAQQQALVAARSGGAITGVGVVPTTGDFDATIAGFRQNAPANSFAVFSFGAFTHRNGMSQYGARARAESGQNAGQILSAYYPGTQIQHNYPAMGEITVDGHGTGSFEDWYLHRIYEVPNSWPKEVLKAQAIAARTYAIRRTNNGQTSICATEQCQVFQNTPKGGAWAEAVQETRGMVLVDGGGSPVSTQYAAIHGGWTNTSGWDTTDGIGGSGNWTTNAWEVKANAPWFYKAWYREIIVPGRPNPHGTYSDLNSSCGRKPWMTQEEMSDIVNAYLLRQNPNGADTGRILPVTLNACPIYTSGGVKITGNPYSMSELRSLVTNPVTNISSVQAINNNNGQTVIVRFETNRGTIEMSGGGFKETFNARAPGYLGIHQSGFSFFNIEHK